MHPSLTCRPQLSNGRFNPHALDTLPARPSPKPCVLKAPPVTLQPLELAATFVRRNHTLTHAHTHTQNAACRANSVSAYLGCPVLLQGPTIQFALLPLVFDLILCSWVAATKCQPFRKGTPSVTGKLLSRSNSHVDGLESLLHRSLVSSLCRMPL